MAFKNHSPGFPKDYSSRAISPTVPFKTTVTYSFPRYPRPMPHAIYNGTSQTCRPHRIWTDRARISLRSNCPSLIQDSLYLSRLMDNCNVDVLVTGGPVAPRGGAPLAI